LNASAISGFLPIRPYRDVPYGAAIGGITDQCVLGLTIPLPLIGRADEVIE
jgi:hypothetical protein